MYRKSMTLLLWHSICLATNVQADSCYREESCADICPWGPDICDNGFDHDCQDKIAGSFVCRDKTRCLDYDRCDDKDAALRSGHLCNTFPYYNGLYPLGDMKYDDEEESYKCNVMVKNSVSSYCSQWTTEENNLTEFELGEATCTDESKNGAYCDKWNIKQNEYEKCWIDIVTYERCDDDGHCETVTESIEYCCSDDGSSDGIECCEDVCDVDFYSSNGKHSEFAYCECRREANNGLFCAEWYCEETDNSDKFEEETYTCLKSGGPNSPSNVSAAVSSVSLDEDNGYYCAKWIGSIDSVPEFEMSKCGCTKPSPDELYCSEWECDERGVDYWWPNMLWCLLSGIVGDGPILALMVLTARKLIYGAPASYSYSDVNTSAWLIGAAVLFWAGGVTMIGVWLAGLGVLFLTYVPLVAVYILVHVWAYCRKRSQRDGTDSSFSIMASIRDFIRCCCLANHKHKEQKLPNRETSTTLELGESYISVNKDSWCSDDPGADGRCENDDDNAPLSEQPSAPYAETTEPNASERLDGAILADPAPGATTTTIAKTGSTAGAPIRGSAVGTFATVATPVVFGDRSTADASIDICSVYVSIPPESELGISVVDKQENELETSLARLTDLNERGLLTDGIYERKVSALLHKYKILTSD